MSDGVEIPVTPEMVKAGGDLLDDFTGACDIAKDLATRTYRAMAAVAPKDEHPWHFHVVPRTQFVDLENENRGWAIVARELSARIAELTAELAAMRIATMKPTAAQQTVGDQKVEPGPKAFPATALQPDKSDHRRVGG